jgi:hypothetical protein
LKSGIEAAHVPPVYVRIPYRSKIAVGGPIYEMVGNNIAYIRTPMPWFGKTTATRWHSRKEIQPTPHLAPMRKRNDVKPKPPGPQEPPWVLTINSARRKMRGKRMARLA